MTDNFYRSFEEIHRGSRDLVKRRTQEYLPLLKALVQMDPAPRALDLGCGRGEWLEVLREQGISAVGVDLDQDMLAPAQNAGLETMLGDAVSCLAQQPDDSLMLVSAFHLVEHLPFSDLKKLVAYARQKLAPGGLLIMETPNPENMVVGTSGFYMDPTHQRPIPPKLLAFVSQYYGFARTKIMRLQESADPFGSEDVTLKQVLEGVSPDYAVVAQKASDSRLQEAINPFFNREYGVSFDTLVRKYDEQKQQRKDMEKQLILQAKKCAAHAEARAFAAEKLATRFQEEADQSKSQLKAVYHSLSWRITHPLRLMKSLVNRLGPAGNSDPLPSCQQDRADMPPTADSIYTDLKAAVDSRDREKE
jgi:SAM-dependent methyltransferase